MQARCESVFREKNNLMPVPYLGGVMHRTQQRPDGSLEENSEINDFVEIVQLKLGVEF